MSPKPTIKTRRRMESNLLNGLKSSINYLHANYAVRMFWWRPYNVVCVSIRAKSFFKITDQKLI